MNYSATPAPTFECLGKKADSDGVDPPLQLI